jgi:2'-5' RNA ligase
MLGKPVDPNRLHVTTQHLGDYAEQIPPSLVPAAIAAAMTVKVEPFDVVFDRIVGTGSKVPLTSL